MALLKANFYSTKQTSTVQSKLLPYAYCELLLRVKTRNEGGVACGVCLCGLAKGVGG